jgi:hypothetical protein
VTPRVAGMTRIVLGLVVVLLLSAATSACTADGSGSGSGSGSGGQDAGNRADARAVKTEVDGEAEAVLPDLVDRLGGELNGMQATFVERGGFGTWDYTAGGALVGPAGTVSQSLTTVETVLDDHGYAVEANGSQKRVTGTKGNVSVIVEASLLSAEEKGSGLNLTIGSTGGIEDGDDYAASTPPEDYTALVR